MYSMYCSAITCAINNSSWVLVCRTLVCRMISMQLLHSKVHSFNLECFIRGVFPDAYSLLETYASTFFAQSIKAQEGNKCSEFNVVMTGRLVNLVYGEGEKLIFRNPSLLPLQLVGMLLGLVVGAAINRSDGMSAAYAHAFFNFAGMNIASIIGHCLAHPSSTLWQFGIDVDVAFTGASCICLILAALNSRGMFRSSRSSICLIAPVCIAIMLLNTHFWGLPFMSEVMYLGTLTIAAAVLFWHYSTTYYQHPQFSSYMSIALAGVLIGACGILFEHNLCRVSFGSYSSISAVFLACCIGFISVYFFAFDMEASKLRKND